MGYPSMPLSIMPATCSGLSLPSRTLTLMPPPQPRADSSLCPQVPSLQSQPLHTGFRGIFLTC